MNALVFYGGHALLLLLFAAATVASGHAALRALGCERGTVPRGVIVAAGLATLGTVGGLLGIAGQLRRVPLLAACALLVAASGRAWRTWRRALPRRSTPVLRAASVALLLVPVVLLALEPPMAFDETLYHLPTSRAFAAAGGLPFLMDLRFPVFPHLGEVLAAELLLVGDDVAAHFVQLVAALATALLLFEWARQLERAGDAAAGAALVSAALWLGNPLVVYLAGTGYVEALLALLVTAAAWTIWRWTRSPEQWRWLLLAGVLAGAAAGTKYLALYAVAAVVVVAIVAPVKAPPSNDSRGLGRPQRAAIALAGACIGAAPWYLRIFAFTGNPVFPYLSGLFGAHPWLPVHMRSFTLDGLVGPRGLARQLLPLLTLFWDVVARRDRVGHLPPISPAYLLLVPLAVVVALARRETLAARRLLVALLVAATGFVAFFPLLPADSRYLVPILPLLSLAGGLAFATLARAAHASSTRFVAVAALVLALPGPLYALYRLDRWGLPPTTFAARDAQLRRVVPGYAAAAWCDRAQHAAGGGGVYGLYTEQLRGYVHGRFLGDYYGPARYELALPLLRHPAVFVAWLRGMDVRWLLVARGDRPAQALLVSRPPAGLVLRYEDAQAVVYAVAPPGAP